MSCNTCAPASSNCTPFNPCPPENYGGMFPSLVGPQGPPGGDGTYVENLAALRVLDPTAFTAGYVANVGGHTTIGDGGGGQFRYDPVSVVADNDGTIVAPNSGIGRWYRVYTGDIYLAWFGVKVGDLVANGPFNDTAAAAAVAIAEVNGSTIVLPVGVMVISTHFPIRNPVTPPVTLKDYRGITVIGAGRSSIVKQWNAGGTAADVFNLNGVKNVNLLNFTIRSQIDSGLSPSGTNGVSIINGGENILCRRIHADKMPYLLSGVDFDGGAAFTIQHASNALNDRNVQIIQCSAEGDPATQCGSYGFSIILSGAGANSNPPQQIIVRGCEFRTLYRGTYLEKIVAAAVSRVDGMQVEITNNQYVDIQQFFTAYGMTGVTFVDNQNDTSFVGPTGFNPAVLTKNGFVVLSCYSCDISHNVCRMAESDDLAVVGGGATGTASTPTDQTNFSHNSFYGATTSTYAIRSSTTESYGFATNCVFVGNTFNGAGTANYDPAFYRAELVNVVFDNEKSVSPSISGASFVEGPNRVTNGTEWTGAAGATPPTGWGVAIPAVFTIVDSGDGPPYDVCLQISINATPAANGSTTFTFATVSGRRYVLSYAFKKGTAVAGSVYIGSTPGANDLYDSGNITDAAWAIRRVFVTAITSQTSITLINRGNVAGETALFDSVSMAEIAASFNGDVLITGRIQAALPLYANNAAALAGGLLPGQFYRVNAAVDPEPTYIVH